MNTREHWLYIYIYNVNITTYAKESKHDFIYVEPYNDPAII